MLILADTNDKIDLVTSAAVTVDVVACYADISSTSFAITDVNKQVTAISTAATTDIVAAPGATTRRNVKSINVRNRHASAPVDVTVRFNDNATIYELHKVTLQAGDCLEYVEGVGWFVVAASTSQQLRTTKLGADVSNSTTTAAIVSGLSITTGLGTFAFQYTILHQAAATTTGIKFSVNHTGTVTALVANVQFATSETTATTTQTAAADQDVLTATAGLYEIFAARAKSTAGWGTSTAADTANADMLTVIEGLLIVTADGSLDLYHGSEVAAATTVKAGSSLVLVRTGS